VGLRSPRRDVAGRWASPPPPRPPPSPAGPRGLPSGPRHPRSEELRWSTLVILAPVQRPWSARIISDRLPWDSSGPPRSRGSSAPCPSIDSSLGVHSRRTGPPRVAARHLVWLRQRGLHPRRSRSVRVVSHHLDGFLRRGRSGASHRSAMGIRCAQRSRACCIPLPILGFAVFPAPPARLDPEGPRSSRRSRSSQRRPPSPRGLIGRCSTPRRSSLDRSRTTSP